MPTTAELTEKYIDKHRSIKESLKKGLVNYSSLARLITKDLKIENSSSKEAILIAARRYKDKIKFSSSEDKVMALFKEGSVDIKNKVIIYTIEKTVYPDSLIDIEKAIKSNKALFFAIEGTKTITVIVQEDNSSLIQKKFSRNIIEKKADLALITISTPGIQDIPGAVSYITNLFSENSINIEEFMSCYEDTLIVVHSKDISKVMDFLNF